MLVGGLAEHAQTRSGGREDRTVGVGAFSCLREKDQRRAGLFVSPLAFVAGSPTHSACRGLLK